MREAEGAVLVGETGVGLFQVRVETGDTSFLADEPASVGGLSSGPDPFALAAAALGACTVMTMRLYARQKGWQMALLSVGVHHDKASPAARDRFHRIIRLDPRLGPDQRARLLAIADRCPVHRMLEGGAEIATTVADDPPERGHAEALHGRIIDMLCRETNAGGGQAA